MSSSHWRIAGGNGPIIATAIHNGHIMRQELAAISALDEATRLREEDPFTGRVAARFDTHIVVETSRFEVDLNRPRTAAVYRQPEDAWGLDLWQRPLTQADVDCSLSVYDGFYRRVAECIETAIDRNGFFILYDIHSYNHRRDGADAPPEDQCDNPDINLGTGTLPPKWRPVADAFMGALASPGLDARENIKFRGGHLSTWIHENYGAKGCALAVELKKTFMDEWSGTLRESDIDCLAQRIVDTRNPVTAAARTV